MFIPDKNRELGKVLLTGQAATTGSATVLGAAQELKNGVIIEALSTNSASVWIGDTTVTAGTGFELQPGGSTSVAIDNISKIYVIGTSGDTVCWISTD